MAYYNPIVRTFCRIRAALVSAGVDRHQITPDAMLSDLIPAARMFQFQRALIDQKLMQDSGRVLTIEHQADEVSELVGGLTFITVFGLLCAGLLNGWIVVIAFAAMMSLVAIVMILEFLSSPLPDSIFSVHSPEHIPATGDTVGDWVIRLTRFSAHKRSGYRFTRNEIALKVRMIVAEQLAMPLDQVREDSRFIDIAN